MTEKWSTTESWFEILHESIFPFPKNPQVICDLFIFWGCHHLLHCGKMISKLKNIFHLKKGASLLSKKIFFCLGHWHQSNIDFSSVESCANIKKGSENLIFPRSNDNFSLQWKIENLFLECKKRSCNKNFVINVSHCPTS